MIQVLRRADEYADLSRAANKLKGFAALIDGLRQAGATMELPEFYDYVCEKTDYVRALQENGDMESRGRIENVEELKSNIIAFLENEPEDATLSGFLNEIALYTDLDSASSDNNVTLMTMHSAKGLEFPCVYVAGMEEGIFPGDRVHGDDEELEEERRLCYVAMTRAKEKLTLVHAKQRMLFGRTTPKMPSRFLEEIPEANTEWLSKPKPSFARDDFSDHYNEHSFGESYGNSYGNRYGGSRGGYDSYSGGHRAAASAGYSSGIAHSKKSTSASSARPTSNAAPMLKLSAGDQINHKTFGDGMVVSVLPMGGDALVEVAFEKVGTKKLMLKTAGLHMTKK